MNRLKRAVVWSFAERYASLAVSVVSAMIIARLLTPKEIGIFSLCAAAVTIATILRDFGISEYIVHEKELTESKLRGAFGIALVLGWSAGALIYTVRHPLAAYYSEPLVADVLGVLALNFLLLPLASPAFALLSREMAFRKIFVVQTLCNLTQAVAAVSLALAGFSVLALAWAPVISIALQVVLLAWMRPSQVFLMPRFRGSLDIFKYGGTFATARVIEVVSRNTHEFLIAKHLGFASVGLFSRSLGLLELFYNNFTAAVLRVFGPIVSEDNRNGRPLPRRYAETTVLLTAIAWPVLTFVALFATDIIGTVFGGQWLAAGPPASLLALSSMGSFLTVLGPTMLITTGRIRLRLGLTLITASVHITAVAVGSRYGLQAVAIAFMASALVGPSLYAHALPKVLGCERRELFQGVGRSVWLGLGFAALVGATAIGLQRTELPSLSKLALAIPAAVAAWFGIARALHHPVLAQLGWLARR